jgi:hypothetical protein
MFSFLFLNEMPEQNNDMTPMLIVLNRFASVYNNGSGS